MPWSYTRNYGCNTPVAGKHLITFRSAAAGFYGSSGMRQSSAGNPHAPVVVPSRRRATAPPPPAPAEGGGGGGEAAYEDYGDGKMMGGQRF